MQAWQATVQDEQGNVVFNPSVTVYLEDGVTLAPIFNEDGSPKENPFIGSLEGFVQFWANPGVYKVLGANGADLTELWEVYLSAGKMPSPAYFAWGGQSNALGSDGGSGTNWITETGKVEVWVPTSGTWEEAATRQGMEPFNLDGSNNPGVHAALEIANRFGVKVRMVLAAEGSTEIEEWTGGGYRNGVPIVADRTVSDTNRPIFKRWTDAISSANIKQFDLFGWWQGEADLDTPEAVYLEEIKFLYDDLKARGTSPDADRRFPMVVHGLYTGPESGQQARRTRTLERFAREQPGIVAYAPSVDLAGRDDNPGGANIINHFTSEAYKIGGKRGGVALSGMWYGNSALSDQRLLDIQIPPTGLEGAKLGYRTYDGPETTDGILNLLVDSGHMRGESYRLNGTCTVNLDPTINSFLGEGGLQFEFYTLSNSDSVTFIANDGTNTRQIQQMGENGSVNGDVGLTITGAAGRGRVVYEGSRYVIQFWPRTSHSTPVLTGGTNQSRRMYNPLELRQAAVATVNLTKGIGEVSTDAGGSFSRTTNQVFHTGEITVSRTINLLNTSAEIGDIITVTRTGSGASTLNVNDSLSASTIKNLNTNEWVECIWDGTIWRQTKFGSL